MKYIIWSETNHLFMGVLNGVAIFSAKNIYLGEKVYVFQTKEAANNFITKYLSELEDISLLEIDTEKEYVGLVDLIKAGVPDYTKDLLMISDTPSDYVH